MVEQGGSTGGRRGCIRTCGRGGRLSDGNRREGTVSGKKRQEKQGGGVKAIRVVGGEAVRVVRRGGSKGGGEGR